MTDPFHSWATLLKLCQLYEGEDIADAPAVVSLSDSSALSDDPWSCVLAMEASGDRPLPMIASTASVTTAYSPEHVPFDPTVFPYELRVVLSPGGALLAKGSVAIEVRARQAGGSMTKGFAPQGMRDGGTAVVPGMTLFERCVASISDLPIDNGEGRNAYAVDDDARTLVRAVLTTLQEHTCSLRTAEEIGRVLAESQL